MKKPVILTAYYDYTKRAVIYQLPQRLFSSEEHDACARYGYYLDSRGLSLHFYEDRISRETAKSVITELHQLLVRNCVIVD